ncbi:MAG TPA: arginine--tRNA ligase [Solirubrobacteraceae bacterium]|jgi:arginyl-tRNA synthetase
MSGAPASPEGLREIVLAAASELAQRSSAPEGVADRRRETIRLERPPGADLGDYSTNAALLLAPIAGCPPRELAEALGERLTNRLGDGLERFEVAGPGFLNLFLSDSWLVGGLQWVLHRGEEWGAKGTVLPERVVVEFVSANPTGPMHIGHARNAAYGDALARLLTFHGHDVRREFYINDAGSQVRKFGESIRALALGEQVPEDGYHGSYVQELTYLGQDGSIDPDELGRRAVAVMVDGMRTSLEGFHVQEFDRWFYESTLHEGDPNPVAHTLQLLEAHGHTYRSEGALWLRTTTFGDDKDRVLIRSDGEHTYFASDIAYHQDKRERGFDRQLDVWGADHHGYTARIRAAYEALGGDPGQLELLIMQLVHLVRSGERSQMSKRTGEFVTLDDLVADIGVDAARWYLLARSHDTTVDLDLDLARRQSSENPVYYVQYAHARIASVLQRAGSERINTATEDVSREDQVALHVAERTLIKKLLAFPGEVEEAAQRRAPHRIASYALELAQDFTAFYRDCHVLGAEPASVESLRVVVCVATQRTIARCLDLLGVSAPQEM